MVSNNTAQEVLDVCKQAETIAITLHKMPDGDSLGASLALAYYFEKELKKKVVIVSPDAVSDFLKPFASLHEILFGKSLHDVTADVFIMPDCGSIEKEEITPSLLNGKLITIDHHESNSFYGDLNYVFPKISSTCSLVFSLFESWSYVCDKYVAVPLLLGMFTDTGGFRYGKSLVKDIGILYHLLSTTGIDYEKELLDNLMYATLQFKQLQGLVLQNIEVYGDFLLSTISFDELQSKSISPVGSRGAISAIQDIKGFVLCCTLTEIEPLVIKGSFRSRDDSARRFSELLGGGGHDKAAAFILRDTSLLDAKKRVLSLVQNT